MKNRILEIEKEIHFETEAMALLKEIALMLVPIVVMSSCVHQTEARIYDRCELARELYFNHRMPPNQISTWVCIAQHESGFNTAAVGTANRDYTSDHGLFQGIVSSRFWHRLLFIFVSTPSTM